MKWVRYLLYALLLVVFVLLAGSLHPMWSEDSKVWIYNSELVQLITITKDLKQQLEVSQTNCYLLTQQLNGFNSQMASFLIDPCMKQLASNQIPNEYESSSIKHIVYNRHSNFNLETRPKYYGYENLDSSTLAQEAADEMTKINEAGKMWEGKFYRDYRKITKDIGYDD